MQARYVLGAGLILGAFAVIAIVAYFANQELYLSVDELVGDPALYQPVAGDVGVVAAAEAAPSESGDLGAMAARRLQVRGVVDYETVERSDEGLDLRFTLAGEDGRLPVVYHGMVPDTFDHAEAVTVAGHVAPDGTFVADNLAVQCPSKYEAVPPGEEASGSGSGVDG